MRGKQVERDEAEKCSLCVYTRVAVPLLHARERAALPASTLTGLTTVDAGRLVHITATTLTACTLTGLTPVNST